jgi:phosphoserine phosphatase RsbX
MGTVKRGMSASDRMAVECGIAAQPLRGEIESGDLHAVIARPDAILIAVVDGLWHGYEAAVAARVAVVTLTAQAHLPLLPLVKCCHEALIKTRGAAMSVALLERGNDTMAWLSIGNVAGIRLRADDWGRVEREHILTRNGVVGHRLPPVRAATLRLHRGICWSLPPTACVRDSTAMSTFTHPRRRSRIASSHNTGRRPMMPWSWWGGGTARAP